MPVKRNGNGELVVRQWMLVLIALASMALGGLTTVFATGRRTGVMEQRVAVNEQSILELKQAIHDNSKMLAEINKRLGRIEGMLEQR